MNFDVFLDESFSPPTDIYTEGGNLVIKMSVAGVKPEDIEVQVSNNRIAVRGKTEEEKEVKKKNYYKKERREGSFYRSLTLPEEVEKDKAGAEFKDGVLTITIPKRTKAKKKEKVIKVKIKKK